MNQSRRYIAFVFMMLLLVFNLTAQTESKDVTITTIGSGSTIEEAQKAALRSAIEQAFGTFISAKTEIVNDNLVRDEIISVANGNIKSYEVLNQDQLPDGRWGVTLKAIVSVDKLTSFAQAKGIAIEVKGGMFALNIKQQLLNEQGEIKAITDMVSLLHETIQMAFDYQIKSSDPKSLDAESKNWEIPLEVTATCNKNIDFCANYFKNTLAALSLSPSEVETYKSLNKQVFPVSVTYQNQTFTYNLRKQSSISAIQSLISNWEGYTRLFAVQSGMDETFGNGMVSLFRLSGSYIESKVNINFPTNGQQAATFSWNDKRTLTQIEQMAGYSVKPRGVVSKIKNGGYVVQEKNGHGLVMALFDVGEFNWTDAKKACADLVLNGYNDWGCPSKEELEYIYKNWFKLNFYCGISAADYWSSKEYDGHNAWYFDFRKGVAEFYYYKGKDTSRRVRAVRTF
jgi:hypothetical protein